MIIRLVLLSLLVPLSGCGGGGAAGPVAPPRPIVVDIDAGSGRGVRAVAGGGVLPPAPPPQLPASGNQTDPWAGIDVPAGAQFTLVVQRFRADVEPAHVAKSVALRDQLRNSTPLKDWYVIHDEQGSVVYHGFYGAIDNRIADPALRSEAARARRDREQIEQLLDRSGQRLFVGVLFLPLSSPDPEAPPQWDLTNTPPEAVWTVQVHAFQGIAERKLAAVLVVEQLRKEGIEAYFYHGPSVSSVCIGAFPANAVEVVTLAERPGENPEGETLVIDLAGVSQTDLRGVGQQGGERTVQQQVRVRDPRIVKLRREFPHAVNDRIQQVQVRDTRTGQFLVKDRPALVVRIPRQAAAAPPGLEEQQGHTPATIHDRLQRIGR